MIPSRNQPNEKNRSAYVFNLTLAAVAGQVGCLTLLIVVGALFGGLWLDSHFATKPAFTIGMMVLSVPVTLILMFWIVRSATAHLRTPPNSKPETHSEGAKGGKESNSWD